MGWITITWNTRWHALRDAAEYRTAPDPGAVEDNVGRVSDERSIVCVELACLVTRTSPLPVCWVSCVLSWHVLSQGQVHYQRGYMSLQCVECRVCWAGTSCQNDGSCTSHRSVTRCSWPSNALGHSPEKCWPLCWSFSVRHSAYTPNLGWTSIIISVRINHKRHIKVYNFGLMSTCLLR